MLMPLRDIACTRLMMLRIAATLIYAASYAMTSARRCRLARRRAAAAAAMMSSF